MKKALITLDIGTSGLKGGLIDSQLQILFSCSKLSRIFRKGTEKTQLDSLMNIIIELIQEITTYAKGFEICGINISGQMGGIIGVDEKGTPLTGFDSGIDTKSEYYNKRLHSILGFEVYQSTCGSPRNTPKIMRWKEQYYDIYKKIDKFLPLHTYVLMQLSGTLPRNIPIDHTMLSFFGNEDARALNWSQTLTKELNLNIEKFPSVTDPCSTIGYISKYFAQKTKLKPGLPLYVGLGDQPAGLLGAGFVHSDELFAVLGSTTLLFGGSGRYIPDQSGRIMYIPSVFNREYYPCYYINGAGLNLSWFAENIKSNETSVNEIFSNLTEDAIKLPPGSESLMFIPYLGGRQCPYDPDYSGSWLGLKWTHKKAHLFRSILESIAYSFKLASNHITMLYSRNSRKIFCSGGGSKNMLWNQIIADVTGIPVQPHKSYHNTLRGTAITGFTATGILSQNDQHLELTETDMIETNHKHYELYKFYTELFELVPELGIDQICRKLSHLNQNEQSI